MGISKIFNRFSFLPLILLIVIPAYSTATDNLKNQINQLEQLVAEDNLQQALSSINEVLKSNPDDPNLRFIHATILEKTGNDEEAKKIYLDLTSGNDNQPEAFNNLAIIYARSGDLDSATSTLEKAFMAHPAYATVYANLQSIYDKIASDAYQVALNLDSPSVELDLTTFSQITALKSDSGQISLTADRTDVESQLGSSIDPGVLEIDRVMNRVEDWAKAWASQDLKQYLSHYADEFKPNDNSSLKEWKNERQKHIISREFIIVDLKNLKIDIHGESANASFTQYYKSNVLEETKNKTLTLKLNNGKWFITREII